MEPEPWSEVLPAVSPAIFTSSLKVGIGTGAIGICVGAVAGTVKRAPPLLFALFSGLQCSAIGSTFWAARSFTNVWQARRTDSDIYSLTARQKSESSTFAGWFTGGFLGLATRGIHHVMPGMFVFSSLGFLGQAAVNALEKRQASPRPPVEEHRTLTERIMNSRFFPMTKLSDAEYEEMLQEKVLRIEAEIAIIDENIQKAQAEMQNNSTKPSKDPETPGK